MFDERNDFWQPSTVARTIIIYAVALAVAAAALQWVQYRYLAHAFSFEIYLGLVAVAFLALGAWAARQLTARAAPFEVNQAAIRSLGLTPRECEIMRRLASGLSNKELARALDISPNTVKTHLASLYAKLEVRNRVEAIEKARWLALIA